MASSGNDLDEYQITNINVTPLVDIMLVLLIIFLVTATYIVKEAVHVELPQASAAGEATPHTLQVLVTKEGRTFVDGRETTDDALVQRVRALPEKKDDVQVLVSADRDAHHGAVIHVLDLLRAEGISKFALQVRHDVAP
jgi:biopolymer transport protein TolR